MSFKSVCLGDSRDGEAVDQVEFPAEPCGLQRARVLVQEGLDDDRDLVALTDGAPDHALPPTMEFVGDRVSGNTEEPFRRGERARRGIAESGWGGGHDVGAKGKLVLS